MKFLLRCASLKKMQLLNVLRLKNQFGNAEIWCHIKQTKIDFHNMKLQKSFHYICYMYNIGELYMGIRIFYVPQLLGKFLACHSIISFTYIHFFAQFSYIVSEISTTYLTTKLHVRPTTCPHIIFPCSISIISRPQSICTTYLLSICT